MTHTVVTADTSFSLDSSPDEWELHPSQILVEGRLGQGVFGEVFRGVVRGGVGLYKCNGPHCLGEVAIKLCKGNGATLLGWSG